MPDRVRVSAADFVRNIGLWQEHATQSPVCITNHGRDRFVLLSAARYDEIQASRVEGRSAEADFSAALVLDHIADGFIALSDDLTVMAVNYAAETYFGLSRRQMEGAALVRLMPTLESSLFVAQMANAAKRREVVTFEARIAAFGDAPVEFRIFPLPHGVGALFANVGERNAQRDELTATRAARAAIDAHPGIALLAVDAGGRLSAVDATFAGWLGFEANALLEWRLSDLVRPDDRALLRACLEDCAAREAPTHVRVRLLAKNLQERAMLLSFSAAPLETRAVGLRVACTLDDELATSEAYPSDAASDARRRDETPNKNNKAHR